VNAVFVIAGCNDREYCTIIQWNSAQNESGFTNDKFVPVRHDLS